MQVALKRAQSHLLNRKGHLGAVLQGDFVSSNGKHLGRYTRGRGGGKEAGCVCV
jgi:hypothetical protein